MEESVLRQKPKLLLEIVYVCALNELDVDDDVRQFVINNLDLLDQIPKNEIYDYFVKILITNNPSQYIREFKELLSSGPIIKSVKKGLKKCLANGDYEVAN